MSVTTERMIHGCWLAHPKWFGSIAELFDERDFADASDKKLWGVAKDLHRSGVEPSPLDALKALQEVDGGKDAIRQLVSLRDLCAGETRESFNRRVDTFVKTCQAKRAKRIAQRTISAVDEGVEGDWASTFIAAGERLRALDKRDQHFVPLTFARFMKTLDVGQKRIIPTGWSGLDKHDAWWVEGEVTCICARTNAGKSSFLDGAVQNQFFAHAAKHPTHLHALHPDRDPFELRREPAHAYYQDKKSGMTAGERAPYVLLLTVEDSLDDCLARFVCNLLDIEGREYRLDPKQAVYASGKGDALEVIARAFTEGERLSIVDYESEDGDDDKTIDQIERTIIGYVSMIEQRHADDPQGRPPILVLLDYFQKVELPEEEGKHSNEYQLLKKASKRLHRLTKKHKFALGLAVMLLRGPDAVAPDHNDARGGSDVIQDMETVISLWPFGPSELSAIEQAAKECGEGHDPDSFEAAVDVVDIELPDFAQNGSEGEDETFDTGPDSPMLPKDLRRAARELIITGHKGRHSRTGWRTPLEFDRAHKRITDPLDDKIFRHDPSIQSLLKESRKMHGQDRKR